MQVLLIRHAESVNNRLVTQVPFAEYLRTRTPDPPLTDRGDAQAELLGRYLGKGETSIDELFASPMLRALQTVRPTAEALGLRPKLWIALHEDGGMFTGDPRSEEGAVGHPGLTRAEFERDHPGVELVDDVTETGWWTAGWESQAACYGRALLVAAELRDRAERERADGHDTTIGLMSHGVFLDGLLKALFGRLPDRNMAFALNNTGLSLVDLRRSDRAFLRYHNCTEHLPPDLITE